jgi:hypothetical protein
LNWHSIQVAYNVIQYFHLSECYFLWNKYIFFTSPKFIIPPHKYHHIIWPYNFEWPIVHICKNYAIKMFFLIFTFTKVAQIFCLTEKLTIKPWVSNLKWFSFWNKFWHLAIKKSWGKFENFPFLSVSLRKNGFFLSVFLVSSSLPICLFFFSYIHYTSKTLNVVMNLLNIQNFILFHFNQ